VIHLATGILIRDDRLLLVASSYPSHAQPLWNLPGGRQLPGELLTETVVREFFEETQLRVGAGQLAYVSESYDGDTHIVNVTFTVSSFDCAPYGRSAQDDTQGRSVRDDTREHDHVVAVEWVPLADVGARIEVAVVREPLLAYLRGELEQRYAGFHQAGVTIRWPRDSH